VVAACVVAACVVGACVVGAGVISGCVVAACVVGAWTDTGWLVEIVPVEVNGLARLLGVRAPFVVVVCLASASGLSTSPASRTTPAPTGIGRAGSGRRKPVGGVDLTGTGTGLA
jgi:hypothetical protein